MKFKLLLLLELKNTLKKIPHIILGVVALIAVIGAITFCGTKYLYNLDMDITINLALVTEDDSKLMTTITNMVTEADSIKEYVNFIPCTRDELPSLLDNGGVYAGIILQEDAAKDIMSGKNTPIEIVFPKNSGFEAAIISEMASAVASMLSTAQAGVYTSIDFYNAHYKYNAKDEMIERLNLTYIVTVLFRGNTFNDHVISATGNISLILYYVIAAIAMFLLFYSINSATIYSRYGMHLSNKLINNNVGILGQMFIKYLSILTSYGFLLIILLPILFYFFEMSIAFSLILPIILATLCISALTLLI
ncbi:MAG: ABC transporter permease, partial [Lachnospiraceae bacterium]|nr:ABC transporter permease [Lachnospiraceae bacterium]